MIYLMMIGVTLVVTILWANAISKTEKEDYEDVDFP
jgi:hypothetical protein